MDPSRDKPELLKKYVPSFDKSFIGLTGSQDQIDKIASQYKIFHKKVGDEKNYTIDNNNKIKETFKKASSNNYKIIKSYKTLKNLKFIEFPKLGFRELKKISRNKKIWVDIK